MSPEELAKLKDYVSRELAPSSCTIQDTTPLFSKRLISSRNLIFLIGFLEKQYKIKISIVDMTLANMDSIQAIDRFVSRKRAAGIAKAA